MQLERVRTANSGLSRASLQVQLPKEDIKAWGLGPAVDTNDPDLGTVVSLSLDPGGLAACGIQQQGPGIHAEKGSGPSCDICTLNWLLRFPQSTASGITGVIQCQSPLATTKAPAQHQPSAYVTPVLNSYALGLWYRCFLLVFSAMGGKMGVAFLHLCFRKDFAE